jgi:hypothetical protein
MARNLSVGESPPAQSSEYESVGTLCDEPTWLTCSYDAAWRWGRAKSIEPYDSFEAAAQAVKEGAISAFLVPCAYPTIGKFIMDAEFVVTDAPVIRIPSLVLVGTEDSLPSYAGTIFHHVATTPLLPEIPIPFGHDVLVSSNVRACTQLLEDPTQGLAITNSLCASFFHLHTLQVLREDMLMPFICFAKKSEVTHHALGRATPTD